MNYPNRIITTGDKDPRVVKYIQTRLNEVGCGLIFVDGIFDQSTLQALKAYQQNHLDEKGNPLLVDGKVGPLTWMSLFYNYYPKELTISPLILALLKIAKAEIGVKEVPPGSNRGPRVEEYLRSVKLGPGYPWCAAFVYWCFEQASASLNRCNPLARTGACMSHWNTTKGIRILPKDAIQNPELIETGDIFIMRRTHGRGHTGIVTGVSGDCIFTIEGNSNTHLSSEGDGVIEQIRMIRTITAGFIRYC